MNESRCPTGEELLAFNLGKLPEHQLGEIAGHLEICAACMAQMDRIDGIEDPMLAAIRSPCSVDAYQAEPEYQSVLSRLADIGRTPAPGIDLAEKATTEGPSEGTMIRDYRLLDDGRTVDDRTDRSAGRGGVGSICSLRDAA